MLNPQCATYQSSRTPFVSVGGAPFTSPDGITWTFRGTGLQSGFDAVAFGNNQFVAVGDFFAISQ